MPPTNSHLQFASHQSNPPPQAKSCPQSTPSQTHINAKLTDPTGCRLECPKCPSRFSQASQLAAHMRDTHNSPQSTVRFVCPGCGTAHDTRRSARECAISDFEPENTLANVMSFTDSQLPELEPITPVVFDEDTNAAEILESIMRPTFPALPFYEMIDPLLVPQLDASPLLPLALPLETRGLPLHESPTDAMSETPLWPNPLTSFASPPDGRTLTSHDDSLSAHLALTRAALESIASQFPSAAADLSPGAILETATRPSSPLPNEQVPPLAVEPVRDETPPPNTQLLYNSLDEIEAAINVLNASLTEKHDLKAIPPPTPATNDPPNTTPHRKLSPAHLQKLYRLHRKKAMRALAGPTCNSHCKVGRDALINHFQRIRPTNQQEALRACGEAPAARTTEAARSILQPITAEEIHERLDRLDRSSSPGPSQIGYKHLYDWAVCRELSKIFNSVLQIGQIPSQWKRADLIFIPKDGNLSQPENWRPIALQDAAYKLCRNPGRAHDLLGAL